MRRVAPSLAARTRNHSSNLSRSTIPTKPPSIGISTWLFFGEIMRAERAFATNNSSGISKSLIKRGGIAPPHGLIRPARSSKRTLCPILAKSPAAVAPAGPPPTTTASKVSRELMMILHGKLNCSVLMYFVFALVGYAQQDEYKKKGLQLLKIRWPQ